MEGGQGAYLAAMDEYDCRILMRRYAPLSPSELDARLVAWDRRAARLAGHMRTMETDGQAWRRVHTQWQWACLHGEAIRRLRP